MRLSIFACPHRWDNPHIKMIQINAIRSWLALMPQPEVILFCDNVNEARAATKDMCGLTYMSQVGRNECGTPLVSELWRHAEKSACGNILCYVNADIILMQDWRVALSKIHSNRFLAVGRRWNFNRPHLIDFETEWEKALRREVCGNAENLHTYRAVDYFAVKGESFANMPPFAIGRPYWDNWFCAEALRRDLPMVDVTEVVTALHQEHGGRGADGNMSYAELFKSLGGKRNIELAGIAIGMICHARHRLTRSGLEHNIPCEMRCREINRNIHDKLVAEHPALQEAMRLCFGRGLELGGRGTLINLPAAIVDIEADDRTRFDFVFADCTIMSDEGTIAIVRWGKWLRPGGTLFLDAGDSAQAAGKLARLLRASGFVTVEDNSNRENAVSYYAAGRKPIGIIA